MTYKHVQTNRCCAFVQCITQFLSQFRPVSDYNSVLCLFFCLRKKR